MIGGLAFGLFHEPLPLSVLPENALMVGLNGCAHCKIGGRPSLCIHWMGPHRSNHIIQCRYQANDASAQVRADGYPQTLPKCSRAAGCLRTPSAFGDSGRAVWMQGASNSGSCNAGGASLLHLGAGAYARARTTVTRVAVDLGC